MPGGGSPGEEEKPIEELITSLFSLAEQEEREFSSLNKGAINQATLKAWLNRLSWMADYQAGGDKRKWLASNVLKYLDLANGDKGFREKFSFILSEATATCGDRVALSILHLGINYQLETIDLTNLEKLKSFLVSGVWKMSLLEEVARAKVPTLRFFDEIEVYLGYPIKLKERLNLPIEIEGMLYFSCSALRAKDLDDAEKYVREVTSDEENRINFLINQEKWREALEIKFPKEMKELRENRIARYENQEEWKTSYRNGLKQLTRQVIAGSDQVR